MSEGQIERLSDRELELLQLVGEGLSNQEIAHQLHISLNTVKVHMRHIFAKLNVRSRTEAVMVAIQSGWIEAPRPKESPSLAQARQEPQNEEILPPEQSVSDQVEQAPAIPATGSVVHPSPEYWIRGFLLVAILVAVMATLLVWVLRPSLSRTTSQTTATPVSTATPASRWSVEARLPEPRSEMAVVLQNEQLYIIGGVVVNEVSDTVWQYSPTSHEWVTMTNKTTAVRQVGAVTLFGKIYVPGGRTAADQVSRQLEVFDPTDGPSGAWSAAQEMPEWPGASQGLCAYAIAEFEGELYLFGGWNGSAYTATAYRYNWREDQWHTLSAMPTPRGFAGAARIGALIYVVGGYDGQSEQAVCEAYNPIDDTWDTCPPMQTPRGGGGVATLHGRLFVIGGGQPGNQIMDGETFTPDSNDPIGGIWASFPSPIQNEWRHVGVAAGTTTLYAVGGRQEGELDTIQSYFVPYRIFLPMGGIYTSPTGAPDK